ncbi:galactose-1-phosphate uridylyltransferase [Microbacterium marinilacus]|uniref:Galactose-1-phosphate uridylyltransferase n=1 Tax=Microbacterium marinilacus TaxID=415209 RepID=A0ABP7BJJ2_9MICO|nr:galactose-1-phosphate uridylyltransferase [Microbacterium marinilacus]MBY0688305.1 galactose-1-phosphate uridylyltransferase [Microbacterium marinilacus]
MPHPDPASAAPADEAPAGAARLGAGVVRRPARLADGRELLYYDDPGTTLPDERRVDERDLTPRPDTATMRRDVLTGDWISVAAARQNRAHLPPADLDPLAPQSPTNPSELPSSYDVAVFENRSPSFGPALDVAVGTEPAAADAPRGLDDLAAPGLGRSRTSVGRCEVVCFSPERTGSFGTQTVTRARTVIEAWADRTAALSALPGIRQVFVFENRGEEIGVTLQHPHGQIYAYPYITPRTQLLLASIEREGADLFERIVAFEQAGPRVVIEGEHWIAYVPFAARWPIEVHLAPRRHAADFTELSGAERDELAPLYLRLLRGLDALYDADTLAFAGGTPYIAAWHQAPVDVARGTARLHLQLTSPRRAADKLKFLAGSEAAMGAWIGDIPPEQAAERLRAALATVPEASA